MERSESTHPQRFVKSIAIVCGGTGGHLAPGIAVAEAMEARGYRCCLFISEKQVDSALVKKYESLHFVRVPGIAFSKNVRGGVRFLAQLTRSVLRARGEFKAMGVDQVLLFGGFLSLGPGLAGRIAGLPIALHEANRVPGKAVRMLSKLASRVYLPEGIDIPNTSEEKVRTMGFPLRKEMVKIDQSEARRLLGLPENGRIIVILGGSQGAEALNDWARTVGPSLGNVVDCLYCVTGFGKGTSANSTLNEDGPEVVEVPFTDQMNVVLSAADLVISRAGAGAIAEITKIGIPSILIPYPFAADAHQKENAASLEATGGCQVLSQKNIGELTEKVIALLQNSEELAATQSALAPINPHSVTEAICDDLECLHRSNFKP